MTYVIAEPCIGVKDGSCAAVCPVDCIHTTDTADMYFIDPTECIDCGICIPECPVDAIYPDNDLPGRWARFTYINEDPGGGLSGRPAPRLNPPSWFSAGAQADPPDGD
jgi:ferredoxin